MRRSGRSIRLLLLLTAAWALLSQGAFAASLAQQLADLDDYAQSSMREWEVPGMAIAVVGQGKTRWMRSYGKSLDRRGKQVSPETLFPIGSLTKAMTAALLAELVSDKRLSWDDPLHLYLPEFQLADTYANWDMRVRDLLTHNSGWAEHSADLLLLDTSHPMLMQRAEFIPAVTSFRGGFAYQNLLYLAAGELIEAVTGQAWEHMLQKQLFAPLGMLKSHSHFRALPLSADVAYPHVRIGGDLHVIPWAEEIDFGAAGSVVSTIEDMSRWLLALLEPSETIRSTMQPQIYLDQEPFLDLLYPDARWVAYGMGWFVVDYQGRRLIEHSGNIPGITAKLGLLPEQGIGIVILCNQEQSLLPHALMMRFFDRLLRLPQRDWSRALKQSVHNSDQWKRQQKQRSRRKRAWHTTPSGELGEFSGSYSDSLHGDLLITTSSEGLNLRLRGLEAKLTHWHYDTWQLHWKLMIPQLYPGSVRLSFHRDSRGQVSRAEIERVGSFTRRKGLAAAPNRPTP